MKSLIFVCLGNICRSPIAEGCAKAYIEESSHPLSISSAGTSAWHIGETPCDNSIEVCKQHAIDISRYKASQFTSADIDRYDLVVALDESNYQDLKQLGVKNLVKLGDYGYGGADVPDPYFFNGFEGFEKVFEMINNSVINLLNEKKR